MDKKYLGLMNYSWYQRYARRYIAMGAYFFGFEIADIVSESDFKPDIVFCHDSLLLPGAARIADQHNARLYFDAVEITDIGERSGRRFRELPFILKRYYTSHIKKSIAKADKIITVGESFTHYIEKQNYRKVDTIVTNARPNHKKAPHDNSIDLRSFLKLSADIPLIVSAGNLYHKEGIDCFLKALQKWPQAHLAVVGNITPQATKQYILQAMPKGRVHLVPAVPWTELPHFISSADIGIVPWGYDKKTPKNLSMGNPNRIFDYLAAGIPFVSAENPDIRKLVAQYGVGKICDTKDLLATLQDVYHQRDDYKILIGKALDNISEEKEIEKFLKLFPDKPQKILFIANKDPSANHRIAKMLRMLSRDEQGQHEVAICSRIKSETEPDRYRYIFPI